MSRGVVEINGRFYQEVAQPEAQKKTHAKRKPKSKKRLKYELWAFFILSGFALILWALQIVTNSYAGTDKVNNIQKKETTKR